MHSPLIDQRRDAKPNLDGNAPIIGLRSLTTGESAVGVNNSIGGSNARLALMILLTRLWSVN